MRNDQFCNCEESMLAFRKVFIVKHSKSCAMYIVTSDMELR